MDMTKHKTNLICPWCDYHMDRSTPMRGEAAPENLDRSICLRCGEWSIFDDAYKAGLRKPNSDEWMEIAESEACGMMREAWLTMQKRHKN